MTGSDATKPTTPTTHSASASAADTAPQTAADAITDTANHTALANLSVLLADDDPSLRLVLGEALTRAGCLVTPAATLAEIDTQLASTTSPSKNSLTPFSVLVIDMLFPDGNALEKIPQLRTQHPDLAIIVMSAQATLLTAVTTQKQASIDAYLPKPFPLDTLLACIGRCVKKPPSKTPTKTTSKTLNPPAKTAATAQGNSAATKAHAKDASPIIGKSPAMQEIYRTIARLVPTDTTVMIRGESGTGKELVARALHNLGNRRHAPFIAINMAAIPQELIEAELFGHEKGAFTGADTRKIGRFEEASGGTLFLDEIGDMPLPAQTRLLRVLQDGVFTRIGGQKPITTHARIISATHKNLDDLVRDGLFREDLYYRLNVVPVTIPPLRQRADDIAELTKHLLAKAAGEGLAEKPLTPEAIKCLEKYDWPGNVRELENVLRRVLLLVDEKVIDAHHITAHLPTKTTTINQGGDLMTELAELADRLIADALANADNNKASGDLHAQVTAAIEKPLLMAALKATNGNQVKTAEMLGINRNTLRKKMAGLGITTHDP